MSSFVELETPHYCQKRTKGEIDNRKWMTFCAKSYWHSVNQLHKELNDQWSECFDKCNNIDLDNHSRKKDEKFHAEKPFFKLQRRLKEYHT